MTTMQRIVLIICIFACGFETGIIATLKAVSG